MAGYTRAGVSVEKLAGTETEKNLHTALSGESQAYLRYKWFEGKAKEDGYVEISELFRDTASNEMEHAEIWFKYLGGWSSTERNLESAAAGEKFEWATMYAEFEQTARREGFDAIADLFSRVASIERQHEDNYKRSLEQMKKGECFSSSQTEKWICINCGYVIEGKEAPSVCPTCAHPQGYFKRYTEK
ncbi:MAG: rubrerythrin family protein [Ruminococcaceae bacterium]|nr:rubrerythrin family protein [Oscillospiraceae bacterium]